MRNTELCIVVGDGKVMNHKLDLLDWENKTIILGRQFLEEFNETTFDWQNMRIKL